MSYELGPTWRRAWAAPTHRVTARFEPVGWEGLRPAVFGGSVTIDGRAPVRRTAQDVQLRFDQAVPQVRQGGWLDPYGAEFRLWRGLQLADGTTLEAPLGVFVLNASALRRASDGGTTATVSGADRAVRIQRARWDKAYQIRPSSGTRAQALAKLLADRWPAVQTDIEDDGTPATRAVYLPGADTDPWADAQALAKAMGLGLEFDRRGVAVATSATSTDTGITYATDAHSAITELDRGVTNDQIYTGVIATGTADAGGGGIPYGEKWDDDPTSPTYYAGPMGKVPYFLASPAIKTDQQAQQAAEQQWNRLLGATETVGWTQLADPTLDTGDIVTVVDEESGTAGRVMVDTISLPLTEATMTVTARVRRRTV